MLFRTDWDRHWGTEAYWESGPHLGEVVVQQLSTSATAPPSRLTPGCSFVPLAVRGGPSLPVRVFAMPWQELDGS